MKTKLSLVGSIILVVAFFVTAEASAYVLYGSAWPTPSATYDAHTMTSSWRSAASYGAGRWESASPFDWRYDSGSINDVFMTDIDGKYGTFATTTVWYYNNWITKMSMRFDNGESWYTGSSSPSSSRLDARSETAHEFGHALGIGHTQSENCSSSVSESNRPTMCSGYKYGKTWKRSLENDDEDAVNAQYDNLLSSPGVSSAEKPSESNVHVDFSYQEFSLLERIQIADEILVGRVVAVSETKWNQDSGLYWEETVADAVGETTYSALPFYEITVESAPLLHGGDKFTETVVTVLGTSPLEASDDAAVFVGDDAFFFIRDTKLAWRGGEKRPVRMLVGDPRTSVLTKRGDGLYRELAAGDDASGISSAALFESIFHERGVSE